MHSLFDEIINNIHLIGFMHHCDRDGKERQSSWKYELAQSNTMVVYAVIIMLSYTLTNRMAI